AQKTMILGLPPEIKSTLFVAPTNLPLILMEPEQAKGKTLLLFKNIEGVMGAVDAGLTLSRLNLGNLAYPQHCQATRLAETFYATAYDLDSLKKLETAGIQLILQAVPSGKAIRWKVPAPSHHRI
ncbi:MAG: PTS sugar transporter subunit IIB, partial [Candidatus Adiutrix sp.]